MTESETHTQRRAARLARFGFIATSGALALFICGILAVVTLYSARQAYAPGGRMSDIQVDRPMPDLTLTTFDGGTIATADLRGTPVALNFWATWCAPCVDELPYLDRAVVTHADVGLRVIGINHNEPLWRVQDFLQQHPLSFPVALDDDGTVMRRFKVFNLPTTLWVDADGVIRFIHLGGLTPEDITHYVALLAPAGESGASGGPSATGTTGASGASGATGASGASGGQGASGASGASSATGAAGTSGPSPITTESP